MQDHLFRFFRRWTMKIILILLSVVAALGVLFWLGLQVQPASLEAFPQQTPPMERVPLPEGLPVPVERLYRQVYGDTLPVIETAVISGRAKLRIAGINLPSRFRFTHIAGQGYRHYIESCWFGIPLFKVNETYLEGKGHLELPMGVFEGQKIDQGANLGLWSENVWMPAVYLTDPRVQWEAVDDVTAILVVPFGEEEERFVVRFDPQTGLLEWMESMRYQGEDSQKKMLWMNHVLEWREVDGYLLPALAALTWMDAGTPWAVWEVEDVVYNADVTEYIRARGE
jgi:hypothetical protein